MTKYFRTALTSTLLGALLGFAALPAMAQPSPMVAQPDAQTATPDAGAATTPVKSKTHHKHHHKTANTQKISKDTDAAAPSAGDPKN